MRCFANSNDKHLSGLCLQCLSWPWTFHGFCSLQDHSLPVCLLCTECPLCPLIGQLWACKTDRTNKLRQSITYLYIWTETLRTWDLLHHFKSFRYHFINPQNCWLCLLPPIDTQAAAATDQFTTHKHRKIEKWFAAEGLLKFRRASCLKITTFLKSL